MTPRMFAAALMAVGCAQAAFATSYTQDNDLSHFTGDVSEYAALSNFFAGDVGSPFTPTTAELSSNGYRVYAGGSISGLDPNNNWILATFSSPVSALRVFPNIDHFGAQYDGYQYTIAGSNDGANWTMLYDTLTVSGASEPFTIGSFTGTAPTRVNNVINGPNGVGYEADFSFSGSYKFYAFGASTVAFAQGNADQELSAIAAVPEPDSLALLLAGLGGLAACARGRRRAT